MVLSLNVNVSKVIGFGYHSSGRKTLTRLLESHHYTISGKIQADLQMCRRMVLTTDCWSKRGLNGSFLAISASFFHPNNHQPKHILLNLHSLSHPHTGDMIADKIQLTLTEWNIPMSKVLTIITDNGSNIIKAVKTLKTNLQKANERKSTTCSDRDDSQTTTTDSETEPEPDALTDSDSDNDDSTLSNTEEQDETDQLQITTGDDDRDDDDDMCLPDSLIINRMPCLSHTLQLVIKALEKMRSIENVIAKVRKLVKMIKISSKANELLISKCGVTLVTECTIRWNSRFMMLDRLLKVKAALKEVLAEIVS